VNLALSKQLADRPEQIAIAEAIHYDLYSVD
jgi:hypothetical protein